MGMLTCVREYGYGLRRTPAATLPKLRTPTCDGRRIGV